MRKLLTAKTEIAAHQAVTVKLPGQHKRAPSSSERRSRVLERFHKRAGYKKMRVTIAILKPSFAKPQNRKAAKKAKGGTRRRAGSPASEAANGCEFKIVPVLLGMRNAEPPKPAKPVERLFPFVLRSRILLVGRDTLLRRKRNLHFVLITEDLSENSRSEILSQFSHYPVVQHYSSADLEAFFGVNGAKVVGFAKSTLAQSIYGELKQFRVNRPPVLS